MREIITHPVMAFMIYSGLVTLLVRLGRVFAGRRLSDTAVQQDIYAGGEEMPPQLHAPGYGIFTQVALFFAVLHLGVLVLATGNHSLTTALYLSAIVLILLVQVIRTRGETT